MKTVNFNDAYEATRKHFGKARFHEVERKIYRALQKANEKDQAINTWLNFAGYANLTVCPECRVDDFVHVEGCKLG